MLSRVLVLNGVLDRKNPLVWLGLARSATLTVCKRCDGALALDHQKDRKVCLPAFTKIKIALVKLNMQGMLTFRNAVMTYSEARK